MWWEEVIYSAGKVVASESGTVVNQIFCPHSSQPDRKSGGALWANSDGQAQIKEFTELASYAEEEKERKKN